MVDKLGETGAADELYIPIGKVIKTQGTPTELVLSIGDGTDKGGKAVRILESDSLNLDSLLTLLTPAVLHVGSAAHGILYHFMVEETGTVDEVDIIHQGELDIALPFACKTGKLGVTTWHSDASPATDWTFQLYKNDVLSASSAVAFDVAAETAKYQSQDWGSEVTFAAGDRFRIECGSATTDTADDPRMHISMVLIPT